MIKIFKKITKWRDFRGSMPANKSIGLVMTMGNLHFGHANLLKRSIQENDITILTIFINPTQFNDKNDFVNYPRTLEQDLQLAEQLGIDYVLRPEYEDLYPDDYKYKIFENELSKIMEGVNRPGHFVGVLTVVMKLLLLVKADRAYFGAKDFQQLKLVDGMAKAFFLDTEVVPCEIIRDKNGVALSSRNNLLNAEQYEQAKCFAKLLASDLPVEEVKKQLEAQGITVDYIEEYAGRRFGAIWAGNVRLIDNVER